MEQAFDISSTIKTLRDGIAKGYWTLEDLDTESPDSRYWRKQALRNVPISDHGTACFMKPHRNLLREHPDEPIQEIEITTTTPDENVQEINVTPEQELSINSRSSSLLQRERPQVFLQKASEDSSAISIDNLPW